MALRHLFRRVCFAALAAADAVDVPLKIPVAQQLRLASLREVSFFNYRLVPCDIDVTPFANPGVHKEGISCTYKLVDGFAPINAYLGGYAECFDLREGKQHSENGAIPSCIAVLLSPKKLM